MKKIVCILRPFDTKQQIYVYENGNKIDTLSIFIDDFNETIFALSSKYNINQVDLTGPKQFARGLTSLFEKEEIKKYNQNKIHINII